MATTTRAGARRRAVNAQGEAIEPERGDREAAAVEEENEADEKPSLAGDWANLGLLLLLYTLQGVPMGLASSVTLILQEKSVSYRDQGAYFSRPLYALS